MASSGISFKKLRWLHGREFGAIRKLGIIPRSPSRAKCDLWGRPSQTTRLRVSVVSCVFVEGSFATQMKDPRKHTKPTLTINLYPGWSLGQISRGIDSIYKAAGESVQASLQKFNLLIKSGLTILKYFSSLPSHDRSNRTSRTYFGWLEIKHDGVPTTLSLEPESSED